MIYKDKYLILEGHYSFGVNRIVEGREITVLPWGLSTYIYCHKQNIPNLPPPMTLFRWDLAPFVPYEHQKVTANFLATHQRAFCWNEAGTGKSASCVWAFLYLAKNNPLIINAKMLVICPLSTVRAVWSKELFMLAPYLKTVEVLGTRDRKLKLLHSEPNVAIINHDGIKTIKRDIIKWKPSLIIIDESTAFKNISTDRWKALRDICEATTYVWMLSGTPAPQAPTDLFAQARIICPELVGRSFVRFRDRVMIQVSMYTWIPRDNWQNIIKDWHVIRFSRQECIDLPEVTSLNYEVELGGLQKQTFNTLRKDAVVMVEEGVITAVNEGVMRGKLLQCCAGFVYVVKDNGERATKNLQPTYRFQALLDVINETSRGVLVFSPFLNAIDAILKLLISKKIKHASIVGSVSSTKRAIIFDKFQKGDIKVLVAHPRTMAHGVTLTYADTVVWYLVTSDNELYEQANSRIQRIGQNYKMRVVHLISTSLEKNVLKRLQQKQSMQGVLLETLANTQKL